MARSGSADPTVIPPFLSLLIYLPWAFLIHILVGSLNSRKYGTGVSESALKPSSWKWRYFPFCPETQRNKAYDQVLVVKPYGENGWDSGWHLRTQLQMGWRRTQKYKNELNDLIIQFQSTCVDGKNAMSYMLHTLFKD